MIPMVRQAALTVLTITTGAVLLVQACTRPQGAGMSMAARPECPHDWDSVSLKRVVPGSGPRSPAGVPGGPGAIAKFPNDGQLSVSGLISSVPEFHDCQKFIVQVNHREEYTGVMAIFARFQLDSAWATDSLLHSTGLWVAEVAAESDYEPLDITYGFNCLAMRDSSGSLQAVMVANGPKEKCGELTAAVWSTKPRLLVTANAAGKGESVPAVARWDWDDLNARQYLGVQCGKAWCEVYSRDGYESSAQHHVVSASIADQEVVNVKGWYDSQRLTRKANSADMSASPLLVPTAGRASVYPVAGLAGRTEKDYAKFLPAAYVTMNYESKYDARMGLRAMIDPPEPSVMKNPAAYNLISLCRGRACDVNKDTVEACSLRMKLAPDDLWFARTKTAKGWNEYCVHYRAFPKDAQGRQLYTVPGVVRWRWKAKDETVWIACPAGCCEVVVDES